MTRAQIIDRLWALIEPTVFISREEYEHDLDGWTFVTEEHEGELAFVAMTYGPHFHIASFQTGMTISRKLARDTLAPIFAEHGHVLTCTPKVGYDRQHRFNRVVGFRKTGENEFFTQYRMEATQCRL